MNSHIVPAGDHATSTPALPGSAVAQVGSKTAVKRGRLPNLARFYREQAAELREPIYPLSYSRINDPEWFKRAQHVVLDLRNGIERQYPGVTAAMVAHINSTAAKIEKLPIGNQFVEGLKTERKYPDLRVSGVRRDRAIDLSKALLDVTRRDPHLVRYGVLGYLYAVDQRMQVLITDHRHAQFGRVFIKMVDQVVGRLGSPWLCRVLEGIEIDGERKDPAVWFDELGLEPLEIPFGKPNTPGNRAELDHFRIGVCLAKGQNRHSREFFEVMMLAAVTELWKCVEP